MFHQEASVETIKLISDCITTSHRTGRFLRFTENLAPNTNSIHTLPQQTLLIEIHPGAGGNVRMVTLKTGAGTCKRAIYKIYPLFTEEISNQKL